jgi:hypothetical protein
MDPYSILNRKARLGIWSKTDKSKNKKSGIMFRKGVIPKNAINSDSDQDSGEEDGLRIFGKAKPKIAETEIVTEEFNAKRKNKKKKKDKKKKQKDKEKRKKDKSKKKKKKKKKDKRKKEKVEAVNIDIVPENKTDFIKELEAELKSFEKNKIDISQNKPKLESIKEEMDSEESKEKENINISVKKIKTSMSKFIKLDTQSKKDFKIESEESEPEEDLAELLGIEDEIESEEMSEKESVESEKKIDSNEEESSSEDSSEDEGLSFIPRLLRGPKVEDKDNEKMEIKKKLLHEENKKMYREMKNKRVDRDEDEDQEDKVSQIII